jgi:hypothetical protein
VTDASPPIGVGPLTEPSKAPSALFHGTNFISAAAIVLTDEIEAEEPVDGEELGAVVCLTSDQEMGRNFAIEFVRVNSDHPVGAVFRLDGAKVAGTQDLFPYHAETAGVFESEYRATGSLDLRKHLLGVTLVGDVDLLDRDSFLDETWDEMPAHQKDWFLDLDGFRTAVEALMTLAGRRRTVRADEDDAEDDPSDD